MCVDRGGGRGWGRKRSNSILNMVNFKHDVPLF